MGDAENARAAYEKARPMAERALAASPNDASRHILLGLIDAGLGRTEEALQEGKRAVQLLPESVDAMDGPLLTIALARIHTLVGNQEEALGLLERSPATPAGMTLPELRLDPTWDSLRANSRFQNLVEQSRSRPRDSVSGVV